MKLMRAMLPLVTLLAIGCGGSSEEPSPRADLAGTWDVLTVDGARLPAPAPEEPEVTLDAIAMTLDGDGAYALASTYRGPDQAPVEATLGGTWSATAAALSFFSDEGPAVVMFGYRLDGAHLVMTDDAGHEWVLRRR